MKITVCAMFKLLSAVLHVIVAHSFEEINRCGFHDAVNCNSSPAKARFEAPTPAKVQQLTLDLTTLVTFSFNVASTAVSFAAITLLICPVKGSRLFVTAATQGTKSSITSHPLYNVIPEVVFPKETTMTNKHNRQRRKRT